MRDIAQGDVQQLLVAGGDHLPAIPSSYQELLNITLRYVAQDGESWLSYAPADRIACVMLFSQEKTHRAEEDMRRMTQELIDRTLDLGGSYYLPYRLHARPDQMVRAYPGLRPFVAKKLSLIHI